MDYKRIKTTINKDIIKKKINLLLTDTTCDQYIIDNVLTDELVSFVFETLCDELHYLYWKPLKDYDEYDVSNFVSYLHRHCKITLILNGGVI